MIPILLFALLTLSGLLSFFKLPITNFPNVSLPVVTVMVAQPGASAQDIETQVTRKVEAALASVSNVKRVTSQISEGASTTIIEFRLGTPIDKATTDARDAVSTVRSDLPKNIQEPLINRLDTEGGAILTYAVSAPDMGMEQLSWFIDDVVSRRLLGVGGVSKVSRQGGLDRAIQVDIDPEAANAFGLSALDVDRQIKAWNADFSAGKIETPQGSQTVRVVSDARSARALESLPIALPNGRSVSLSSIARVVDGATAPKQIARWNGQPVVGFGVYRAKGSSEVSAADGAKAQIEILRKQYPSMRFEPIATTVAFVERSYSSALTSFFEGMVLAVVVVFLFLRNWRATLISGLAIPLSVIPTFLLMDALGFTLNVVSLLALSLVSGILVDDAIVEVENIMRHIRMRKGAYQAALDAADEIGLAVTATTGVIIAVFVPVSFMDGVVGQYFREFGLTVAIATFFSYLVSRLITPVMCAYFLPSNSQEHAEPRWIQWYVALLSKALAHPAITVFIGVALLVGSFALAPLIPQGFIPPDDRDQAIAIFETPPGSRIQQADLAASAMSAIALSDPEVSDTLVTLGQNMDGSDAESRKGTMIVKFKPRGSRTSASKDIQTRLQARFEKLPSIRASFLSDNGQKELSFSLVSDDPIALSKAAEAVEAQMRALPQLTAVVSTKPLPKPETRIVPNREAMSLAGASPATLAEVANIALGNELPSNQAKMVVDGRQIPIVVQMDESSRQNPDALASLRVPTSKGGSAPLGSLATISYGTGPATISRYNRQRQISLEASLNAGVALGEAQNAIDQLDAIAKLPPGVERKATGDAELQSEMFESFASAMAFGVLMVLGVLMLLFRTPWQPFTIMTALPLSIGGALLALLVTQTPLCLPAVIGLLMLMGIVGKNAILLVDFSIEKQNAGMSALDALKQAGAERAQPIVMTTMAMIAGMLPVVMGLNADSAFRFPMAVALCGGLIASTVLSLVFVPVVYWYVDRFERWSGPKLSRMTTREK
jgi:hydrophobe/amphiphile efflux-1 (HAE1) family protein